MSIQLYADKSNGTIDNHNKLDVANDSFSTYFLLRFTEVNNCNNIKIAIFQNISTNCDISLINIKTVPQLNEDLNIGFIYFQNSGRYNVDVYKQISSTNLDITQAEYVYSSTLVVNKVDYCNSEVIDDFCNQLNSCTDFTTLAGNVISNSNQINDINIELGLISDEVDDLNTDLQALEDRVDLLEGGDMLKSVYDVDNNGIVDKAQSVSNFYYFQEAVSKSSPVYIATSGNPSFVAKAMSSDPSKCVAIGLAKESYTGGQIGEVITLGKLTGLNITDSVNTLLYVGLLGGLTNIKPSKNSQIVAIVDQTGGSDGVVLINPQPVFDRDLNVASISNGAILSSSLNEKTFLFIGSAGSVTINSSFLNVGESAKIIQYGVSACTVVGSGVTLNGFNSKLTTEGQNSELIITKINSNTYQVSVVNVETTTTIQTKRPLKTINGTSLEGSGDAVNELAVDDFWVENTWSLPNTATTATSYSGFYYLAVASGTFGASTIAFNISKFWGGMMMRSSTSANSGVNVRTGSLRTNSSMQAIYFTSDRKLFSRTILSVWNNTATELGFFGFSDYVSITATGDPTIINNSAGGALFKITNNVISCCTYTGATKSINANTFTLTASTIYVLDITGDSNSVVFSIKNASGVEVFTCTNTLYIPSTANDSFGYVSTMYSTATTAKDLAVLYKTGFGTLKAYNKLG